MGNETQPGAGTGAAAPETPAGAGTAAAGVGGGTATAAGAAAGGAGGPTAGAPGAGPADSGAGHAAAAATGGDGTAGAREADKGAAQPGPKAPAQYALTVPEALAAHLSAADRSQLEALYRTADLTNDEAQAALDNVLGTLQAQADRYLAETRADPTYGGGRLPETQRLARLAVDKLRPATDPRRQAFLAFLERGGAQNSLEVVSFLADLGALMTEDSPPFGKGGSGGQPRSDADVLYDHPSSHPA